MSIIQLTGGSKFSELTENSSPGIGAEFAFSELGSSFKISLSDLQSAISLANLDDSGSNVINSVSGTGYFQWENLRLDGNILSAQNTNGGITLSPNGTGVVSIGNISVDTNSITGSSNLDITSSGGNVSVEGIEFNSNNITALSGNLSINSLVFPTSDGTNGQVVSTDGLGNLSFINPSFSPSGSAGGDLTGSYPNPTLIASLRDNIPSSDEKAALLGTDGAPSNSNRYVTNSDSRLSASPPSGAAGGELSGTYPNPLIGSNVVELPNLALSLSSLIPSSGEKDALAGSSGVPSSSNRYVTENDPRVISIDFENTDPTGTTSLPSSLQLGTSRAITATESVIDQIVVDNSSGSSSITALIVGFLHIGSTTPSSVDLTVMIRRATLNPPPDGLISAWRKRIRPSDADGEDLYMIIGEATIPASTSRSYNLSAINNNAQAYRANSRGMIALYN